MSLFKALVSVAAVAAVGYAGYKVASKHPKATAAVLDAIITASAPKPTPRVETETVVVTTTTTTSCNSPRVVVEEEEVNGEDYRVMGGAMTEAAVLQHNPVSVGYDLASNDIVVTHRVPAYKDKLSDNDTARVFR